MLRLALNACPARTAQPPLSSRAGVSAALRPARLRAPRPVAAGRAGFRVNALGKSPEELAKLQAEYEEAMKDPVKAAALQAQAEAYKKAMETPEAKAQAAQMASFMSNPEVQKRMVEMQNDPEMKDFFDAVKTGGPAALAKFWNDEKLLLKISQRLGGAAGQGPPPQAAPQKPPEVTNLLEACRWGDVEAAEDFIAIGKSVDEADKEGRTPLHFAVAFGRGEPGIQILKMLLEAGAKPDAVDTKKNTTLHYAAGYGRADYAAILMDAGASIAARNETGKTPLDLVKVNAQNPVNSNEAVMKRLRGGSHFDDV